MFSLLLKDLKILLLPSIFLLLRHVYNHLCKKIIWTSHDHRHPLRLCITSSTSNISSNIYLKGLRALSRGLISLTNELAPTYRARHPHGPSASFLYVPTYVVEYLQGASAPFSCFYNNTNTDTNCCCCCCCQYKPSAGSRKEQIVNTAGSTSSISSNTASTASSISSITASTASTADTANFTIVI